MITIIIISVLSVLVVILGWTTLNLMKKQEKSEDILLGYVDYLDKFSRIIEVSNKKLKDVDNRKIFEKDDDVGVIFDSILKIQDILNEFNVKKYK
jgi:ABC-type Na+ efflux pump permease subunit